MRGGRTMRQVLDWSENVIRRDSEAAVTLKLHTPIVGFGLHLAQTDDIFPTLLAQCPRTRTRRGSQ